MPIKTLVMGVAIALAATVGSAYAAEKFTALDGIPAQVMSAPAMASVVGAEGTLIINIANTSSAVGGTGITTMPNQAGAGLGGNPNTLVIIDWVCPPPC